MSAGSFMLKGKKILLGISGSIAAYKSAVLTRLLIKAGAEVKIVMTPAAKDFVTPVTLSTLSKNPVLADLTENDSWANHVMLGRWADVMLIAPLSCNTLAKMAHGLCDNLLTAVYLSATCPVIVAPAMDEDMWHHASTKKNLETLHGFGNQVIPVDNGELASGLVGEGRMAEPEAIVEYVNGFFLSKNDLLGKRILITAGPTYEKLDPVRFIGNHSSGKMGIALAEEMKKRGGEVTLVLGPSDCKVYGGINLIRVTTAAEMFNACETAFEGSDISIMSAAVADYTPLNVSDQKIKKKEDEFTLQLTKTKDILKTLGNRKRKDQVLVGFALETDREQENAVEKLESKNADLIVLNSLNDAGAGFGHDTNKITIFDRAGRSFPFAVKSKKEVAADIVNTIIQQFYAKN
jgi:phosphopantothenoylcysteine decarboxylase / phosphopantothenate---cysteine ligase